MSERWFCDICERLAGEFLLTSPPKCATCKMALRNIDAGAAAQIEGLANRVRALYKSRERERKEGQKYPPGVTPKYERALIRIEFNMLGFELQTAAWPTVPRVDEIVAVIGLPPAAVTRVAWLHDGSARVLLQMIEPTAAGETK